MAFHDLFDLAGEHRSSDRREAVVSGDRDAGAFGIVGHDARERFLERVLIVEHIQLAHAQRAHQLNLRFRLRDVAGLQAHERALAARVEARRLVLAGVEATTSARHTGCPG